MPPLSLQPSQARRASRRKVRIVKRRRLSRGAIVTFVLGAAAALAFPLYWQISRPVASVETTDEPAARDSAWKCEGGHAFQADFRIGPMPCPRCNRSAYPRAVYTCPVHGGFEVAAEFSRRADGRAVVARLRLIGRRWVSEKELECPRCDRPLAYKGRDPLERARRDRRPGGS